MKSFNNIAPIIAFTYGLVVGLGATSTGVNIIDDDPNEPIEKIVKDICWSEDLTKQISKVSTINNAIEYLKSLPVEHEFASCGQKNLPILKHLKLVLSQGNANACGHTKIGFIEAFHRRFIDVKNAIVTRETSLIIRTFFLQYSSMISQLCATSGLKFLQTGNDVVLSNEISRIMDLYLEQFRKHIEISVSDYNHIFLVWGLVDQWPVSVQGRLGKYLGHGKKRISIKVKNTETFEKVQSVCSNELKPLYKESLLSSLRLISLGYYPLSQDLIQYLSSHSEARRLYDFVQLCEAILPIRVISDTSMNDGQIIFLTTEESQKWVDSSSGEESKLNDEVSTRADVVSLESMNQLEPVNEDHATEIVERIEQDLYERDSSLSRMIQMIGRSAKRGFVNNFFVSSGNGEVKNFENSFGTVEKAIKDQELQQQQIQLADQQEQRAKRFLYVRIARRRRWWWRRCNSKYVYISPFALVRNIFYFFVLILMLIAYFAISLADW